MKSAIATVATLAVASQGFLLPPEVSENDIHIVNTLDFTTQDRQLVELPCPGCPVQFVNHHGKIHSTTHRPNHLSLLFKVESKDTDRILLNGFELYPHADPFHSALTAPQTVDRPFHPKHHEKDRKKEHKGHRRPKHHEVLTPELGFTMATIESKDVVGRSTVNLDFQVIEVAGQFVQGIPSVQVKLTKDDAGHMTIESADMVDRQVGQAQAQAATRIEECHDVWCKWLAAIEGKVGRPLRNCGKGRAPNALQSHHKFHPDRFRHHERTWASLVKNIAVNVFLPVLIGVFAGVSSCIIGMIVGTLIVKVWRFFRRGQSSCRRASPHKVAAKEAAVVEEKVGLMEEEEQAAPPVYQEEAPAAEDKTPEA